MNFLQRGAVVGKKFRKKRPFIYTVSFYFLISFCIVPVFLLNAASSMEQKKIFRQSIPSIAKQFIGIPYKLGGDPRKFGTSDNSYLFFSIYDMAAQKAGLFYEGYLPMAHLLRNTIEITRNDLQNGDFIVLNNDHAAMIYQIENSGKMHFIYASQKRQQIFSFSSDNLVFQIYWLENFKGFYRLSDTMLESVY
ncbi:MAG: peptidoglycan endopeptidase [Thermodesulfobacteriota bacterium]|nr:peptidoglycan endopeptidase [Thermodesulfobacteriota bacterium]